MEDKGNDGMEKEERKTPSVKRKDRGSGSAPMTELKRQKSEHNWDAIKCKDDLEQTEKFAVVPSRLAATPSHTAQYQHLCKVTGPEILRRINPPENMSVTALAQMLRIGKATSDAKQLSTIVRACAEFTPRPRMATAVLSPYTVMTEEEVQNLATSTAELAAVHINSGKVAQVLWDSLTEKTEAQKSEALLTAREVLEKLFDSIQGEADDFDLVTHGGISIIEEVIQWVMDIISEKL